MNKKLRGKIKEIEKEIPNLDANDGVLDFEIDDWNDYAVIKDYIEKKYPGIGLSRLKIGDHRFCYKKNNYYQKVLNA